EASAPTPTASKSSHEVSLDLLTIRDGQIGVTDLQQKRPRTVYDHIDLTLRNYSPQQQFSFDLAAHLPGEGAQEVRLKGDGGPISTSNPGDSPFHGTLSVNQVGIGGLMKFLDNSAVPQADGILSGESEVTSRSGEITTTGKLKFDKARINKVDIGYPIQ